MIVHVLVWLGVAVQLVCCIGLVTMRNAIDRLHYAGAATVTGPALIAAAVCFEEGLFTTNGMNAVAVAAMLAVLGGGLSIATARAIRVRDRGTLESSPAERERAP
ncbi:MAG TPA: monovalent cation/H(+) antiporter subunit G [Gaiellaceae bacterium]|nr:monovalent cation/H(+) antiporter subunit G [Gaiellaceae bacterium]